MVKTSRIGIQVPLSNHRRRVAGLLQHLRKSELVAIKSGATVRIKTILVTMLSSQHTRSAGTTDGICAKGIHKDRAVTSNTINVRSSINLGTVGADGLAGVVIREDEHDVGAR